MPILYPTDAAGNPTSAPVPPTGANATQVQGTTTAGASVTTNPVMTGVNADGANGAAASAQLLAGDAAKSAKVNPEGQKATYTAAFQVTPAAAATDIAQLIGSATKVVKVTRVAIAGIATAAALIDVLGIKRSAPDTGGTITAQTAVNHDNADAVATAVCSAITANPTAGATGSKYGTMRFSKCELQVAAGSTAPTPTVWDFGPRSEKSCTLRGVNDALCLNLNGVQSAGQVMDVEITWTEE